MRMLQSVLGHSSEQGITNCGVLGTSLHPGNHIGTLLLIKQACCAVIADCVSFYFVYKHYTNHSSRSTVFQLKCVSNTILNLFDDRQPQKTKISTVTDAPFIQNSSQMASRLTAATSFQREAFSTPAIFKATSKLFGSQGCSNDKKLT